MSKGTHPLRFATDALWDDPGTRLAIVSRGTIQMVANGSIGPKSMGKNCKEAEVNDFDTLLESFNLQFDTNRTLDSIDESLTINGTDEDFLHRMLRDIRSGTLHTQSKRTNLTEALGADFITPDQRAIFGPPVQPRISTSCVGD